jgi:hypothetical protein
MMKEKRNMQNCEKAKFKSNRNYETEERGAGIVELKYVYVSMV